MACPTRCTASSAGPRLCLGFDLFLAGYLAGLAVERRRGDGGAG